MNLIQKQQLIKKVAVFEDASVDLPEDVERKYVYPLYSDILPNGQLRMNTAGVLKSGERWDGHEIISPDHPMYFEWKAIIEQKSYYIAIQEEIRQEERKQRRRLKRGGLTSDVGDER